MTQVRALATDAVIFIDGQVVLLRRSHPPETGRWVLPGGIVDPGETARAACAREVAEEVGLGVTVGPFVGLYDDPDRDERGNVSAAYVCHTVDDRPPEPTAEASAVGTFHPDTLPKMGFDHAEIVADSRAFSP